jgi:hypothetical protein
MRSPVQRARAVPREELLSPVLATFAIFAIFANFEDFKFSSGDTNTVMTGFALPVRRVDYRYFVDRAQEES